MWSRTSLQADIPRIFPRGADAALELVGTPTLPDTLAFNPRLEHGLLHRYAVQRVDRAGFLLDRIDPQWGTPHRLQRRTTFNILRAPAGYLRHLHRPESRLQ